MSSEQKDKTWTTVRRAFFWTIVVGGAFTALLFLLFAIAELNLGEVAVVGFSLLGFAVVVGGIGFALKKLVGFGLEAATSDEAEAGDPLRIDREAERLEGQVLLLAKQCDGRLTVAELAVETSFDIDEARAALHECAEKGVAELQMTDSGHEVYVFPAFLEEEGE